MSTNEQNFDDIINNGGELVSEEEFWSTVLGYNMNEVHKDAMKVLETFDEIIMDRIGENMEITTGVVEAYDEKNKKAVVNLVSSVDYVVEAILNKEGQEEISRKFSNINNTISVYNFSIFDELRKGDAVILVHPQKGYSSDYFIIGVLKPQEFYSLIDKCKVLIDENKKRIIEINSLKDRVTRLEDQITRLSNKVESINSAT